MKTFAGKSGQVAVDAEAIARLEGAWLLATIELPDASGVMRSTDVEGLLVVTHDGRMAVQVHNLEAGHVDSAYSSGGYEASYGSITLDAESGIFTYHIEGALVRELVGQDFPRAYSFVDDKLILTSTHSHEKWRAIWRRG